MSDVQSFIRTLLSTEPKPPHSIQLEIDTDGDPAGLFEVLLTVMIGVLGNWYTSPINLATISAEHTQKLFDYFASFGVQIEIDVRDPPSMLRIDNKSYINKQNLEEMTFQMVCDSKLFTVRYLLF